MNEKYLRRKLKGNIPNGWTIKKLEDVADKNDKYSITGGPFGSDLKSEHYTDKGIRVIQLQNIGDGYFNNDYKIYTSIEKANELKNCNIYPEDIIIAKMAEPVARACKISVEEDRYLMCSDGIRLLVDKNEMDTDYTIYAINSKYFRAGAIASSTGSTRLRIGLSTLRTLPLLVPPLKEQNKIASILSSVDEHIEEVDGMIEDLKALKKGLMQKFLTGQYTLENGKLVKTKEFKKTRLGMIPKSWQIYKLNDLIDINPRKEHIEDRNTKVSFLAMADVSNDGKVIDKQVKSYDEVKNGFTGFRNNDVLLAKITPCFENGKRALVKNLLNEIGFGSTEWHVLRGNKRLISEYIYYFIATHDFRSKAEMNMTGSAGQKRVTTDFIKNYKLAVPPITEQKIITSILSSVDERIDIYKKEKNDLQQLKKGLMQQLLTGKIRVKV